VSTLPARRTRLFGRDQDVAALHDLVLHGDRRLVTLTGPGGVGKTSLAMEVGRSVAASLADGAALADLVDVETTGDVTRAVTLALGLIDETRSAEVVLAEYLVPRQLLLIVDNAEHVNNAAGALIDRMLDRAPYARFLVTSRVALHLRGETVWSVSPMAVPASDEVTPAEIERTASVKLFVDRAQAARRTFTLTAGIAPSVAEICRRVDGLPLAIEIAAARTATLGPSEILASLDAAPRATRSAVAGPRRQQTMNAALDWSFNLLPTSEQTLFARLGVFVGGWSLGAAAQVCSPDDSIDIDRSLAALVDNSLVEADTSEGATRFRMLAPIAEYARERLVERGERDLVAAAHARWAIGVVMARSAKSAHLSPEDLGRIEADIENVLAALRWAEDRTDLGLTVGLMFGLYEYMGIRGQWRLLMSHLEVTLALIGDAPDPRRLSLEIALATTIENLGHLAQSRSIAERTLVSARAAGDKLMQRTVLGVLGNVAAASGDIDAARSNYRAALALMDESQVSGLGLWYSNMGGFELQAGNLEAAEAALTRSVELLTAAQPVWFIGTALTRLATTLRREGQIDRAEQVLADAFVELDRYGAVSGTVHCLEEAARIALLRSDAARAAALLAAAGRTREEIGMTYHAATRREMTATLGEVRGALSPQLFDAAWQKGRSLTRVESIELATAIDDRWSRSLSVERASEPALTRRELEVARLVADGLTNGQIAERLAISPGTSRIHVERVREKLGCSSRVQIAAWVLRQR
jgi:predicted ATPase/DNA-binding CsgD family transcriptional regulator